MFALHLTNQYFDDPLHYFSKELLILIRFALLKNVNTKNIMCSFNMLSNQFIKSDHIMLPFVGRRGLAFSLSFKCFEFSVVVVSVFESNGCAKQRLVMLLLNNKAITIHVVVGPVKSIFLFEFILRYDKTIGIIVKYVLFHNFI